MSFRLSVARAQITQALRRSVVTSVNNQSVATHPQTRFLNTSRSLKDEQQQTVTRHDDFKKLYKKENQVKKDYEGDLFELNQSLTLSNQRTEDGNVKLTDIHTVMNLYYKLRDTGALSRTDISHILQALHNSGRMSVRTMARVISKQRKSAILKQQEQLGQYLDIIARDLLSGVVKPGHFGLMHLFTAYATVDQAQKGMAMYHRFMESANDDLLKNTLNFKVTGAVLHLMISAGASLPQIEGVYMAERERGEGSINSDHNMTRAYILNNDLASALKLFSNMLKVYEMTIENEAYFSRVHDTFIGDCADTEIAKAYFTQAVENQTPYNVTIHPSSVRRLIDRCWANNHNMDEITGIWSQYLSKSLVFSEGNTNLVSYSLFEKFFEQNPNCTDEAHEYLKNMIATYNDKVGSMGVLFLNSLLSVAAKHWHDKAVVMQIIDGFDLYQLPKKVDTLRIILNSFQEIDVELPMVEKYWNERLQQESLVPLQKYDFWALGKATTVPGRTDYFISQWKAYAEAVNLPRNMQQDLLKFFNARSNGCQTLAKALQEAQLL